MAFFCSFLFIVFSVKMAHRTSSYNGASDCSMSEANALLLLQDPQTPSLQALVDELRQRHPHQPWSIGSTNPNGPASPFILCGNRRIALTPVDAPIPRDDALWERAGLLWPEAQHSIAGHRAHLAVSINDPGASELEGARIATAVIGALISTLPGVCAVVWRRIVGRSPKTWQERARNSFAPFPDYPVSLWIDILPFK